MLGLFKKKEESPVVEAIRVAEEHGSLPARKKRRPLDSWRRPQTMSRAARARARKRI